MLACAGCDGVFGIDTVPLAVDASDAAPPLDSPQGGSLQLVLPAPPSVYVDDVVPIAVSIHGPANASVATTTTASVGSVTPMMGTSTLDGNGLGQLGVTYTAPSTVFPVSLSFAASVGGLSDAQMMSLTVMPLSSVGIDAAQASFESINPNIAIGAQIKLQSPAKVRDIGLYTTAGGTHVSAAIYDLVSSGPTMGYPFHLQVAAAPAVVSAGRTVIPVTPTMLPAGTYWIIAVFDGSTSVEWQASGLFGAEAYNYTAPYPAVWPTSWVDVSNKTYAFFALVE
jgi:hypothetical protein